MATISPKIIWTIQAICEYCAISESMFYYLVEKKRLPATVIKGKWCAHADNLDDFFKIGTKTPPANLEVEAE